jgi:hypothetical protein
MNVWPLDPATGDEPKRDLDGAQVGLLHPSMIRPCRRKARPGRTSGQRKRRA